MIERVAIAKASRTNREPSLRWGIFMVFLVSSFALPDRTVRPDFLAGESSHFRNLAGVRRSAKRNADWPARSCFVLARRTAWMGLDRKPALEKALRVRRSWAWERGPGDPAVGGFEGFVCGGGDDGLLRVYGKDRGDVLGGWRRNFTPVHAGVGCAEDGSGAAHDPADQACRG